MRSSHEFIKHDYFKLRFLEYLILVTSKMSGTHSKSSLASEASQVEHVEMESSSSLKTFEREDTVIEGLLSGLYKVVS